MSELYLNSDPNSHGRVSGPGRIAARSHQALKCTSEQLYDAWLDPKKIREWMANSLKSFGLPGEIRRVETDPRIGGRFCFSDLRNGTEVVHVGEYLDLERPRRIVFTWIVGEPAPGDESPSKVTLIIEPCDGGCLATIVHEMDARWAEYVSRTEDGWRRMLTAAGALFDDPS